MDKKTKVCVDMLRQLVADIQGSPYPGSDVNGELYSIWYEHAQQVAVNCFEFLDANYPEESSEVSKKLEKFFK